jgi:diguanylate cyclase (GGDEF)-like protein
MRVDEVTTEKIRVLLVEDLEADAKRALYQLQRAGIHCLWKRVETEGALVSALRDFQPDVIISDYSLPQFDGMSALRVCREVAPNVPFLFLSGTLGEERAIQALHGGALDYVLKENMARFGPAVERAIGEAKARQERIRQDAQIARLNRVLRMQSGVSGLVLRIRDRTELLRETCRFAVFAGGYAAAIAAAEVEGDGRIQPVAWSGIDDEMTEQLRAYVAAAATRESGVIGTVLRTGREFVSNNTGDLASTATFDSLLVHARMQSVVVLPLVVDGTAIAVLVLTARDRDVLSEEELLMLREVAGNLSFGLQYLQRDTTARFLSHFDPQTSLAKRPLFCERAQRLMSQQRRDGAHHAVVVMDIERLSVINDSFGRRIGDLLLQHVADRLKRRFPQTEHVAHFGGGTFAVVLPQDGVTSEQARAAGYRDAELIFAEPFLIEGQVIPVPIRIGGALSPEDGDDATTLVQNAEAALRYARAAGEKHAHYDATVRSQSVDQLALEHRLRFALERGEFELHYQPKVSVADGHIQGAEALLRWRSPESGLLAPAAFLPVLEGTGLIAQVGEWVVQQAARDCQHWMRSGLPPVRVAVNVAPAQLRHQDFEPGFLSAVDQWSTPDWGLDIEITEGVLQGDYPAEVGKLQRLREHGTRIAIDDFGTGYSSLSRLATLPIDTLKIDRSFVSRLRRTASGRSLVSTIIALARSLEMTTVAEGVEKSEELRLLRRMGCDQSQGYLHGAAMPAAEFAALLRKGGRA